MNLRSREDVETFVETYVAEGKYLVGKSGDRYYLESIIGAGAMGVVALANVMKGGRKQRVAVKILISPSGFSSVDQKVALERFYLEQDSLRSLGNHPSIAEYYDTSPPNAPSEEELIFFVTEFVDGKPLSSYIEEGYLFSLKEIVAIAALVLAAAALCHRKGLIHRDFKPENVMLIEIASRIIDGVPSYTFERYFVKILDFGIAKGMRPENEAHLTRVGLVVGTPCYMSPEQCAGAELTPISDLYSIGVILYHLLCGRLPDTMEDTIRSTPQNVIPILVFHSVEGFKDIPALEHNRYQPFLDFVLKLLQKEPGDRFGSAEEALLVLAKLVTADPRLLLSLENDLRCGPEMWIPEQGGMFPGDFADLSDVKEQISLMATGQHDTPNSPLKATAAFPVNDPLFSPSPTPGSTMAYAGVSDRSSGEHSISSPVPQPFSSDSSHIDEPTIRASDSTFSLKKEGSPHVVMSPTEQQDFSKQMEKKAKKVPLWLKLLFISGGVFFLLLLVFAIILVLEDPPKPSLVPSLRRMVRKIPIPVRRRKILVRPSVSVKLSFAFRSVWKLVSKKRSVFSSRPFAVFHPMSQGKKNAFDALIVYGDMFSFYRFSFTTGSLKAKRLMHCQYPARRSSVSHIFTSAVWNPFSSTFVLALARRRTYGASRRVSLRTSFLQVRFVATRRKCPKLQYRFSRQNASVSRSVVQLRPFSDNRLLARYFRLNRQISSSRHFDIAVKGNGDVDHTYKARSFKNISTVWQKQYRLRLRKNGLQYVDQREMLRNKAWKAVHFAMSKKLDIHSVWKTSSVEASKRLPFMFVRLAEGTQYRAKFSLILVQAFPVKSIKK